MSYIEYTPQDYVLVRKVADSFAISTLNIYYFLLSMRKTKLNSVNDNSGYRVMSLLSASVV